MYVKNCGWMDLIQILQTIDTLTGPLLWTLCLLGIALNVGVILSYAMTMTTPSSIIIMMTSLILIIKGLNMMIIHDILAGMKYPNDYHS